MKKKGYEIYCFGNRIAINFENVSFMSRCSSSEPDRKDANITIYMVGDDDPLEINSSKENVMGLVIAYKSYLGIDE